MDSFNPYHVWLELSDSITAPNHFELLGLDESEDDSKAVAAAADRAASKVRRCRPGEHAAEWAALLDQIAEAKKSLSDPRKRTEYLRTLNGKPAEKSRSTAPSSTKSSSKPTRSIDPNMYPPGLAPAGAPLSSTPSSPAKSSAAPSPVPDVRRSPAPESAPGSAPGSAPQAVSADLISPLDDAALLDSSPPSPESVCVPGYPQVDAAMQPYEVPGALPMSPAGVPYLQPADPSGLPEPLHPGMPPLPSTSYAPVAPPMAASPMAPMDYGAAMAAVPASGFPMAAVPMGMPNMPAPGQPLPYGSMPYPMGTALPGAPNPTTGQISPSPLEVTPLPSQQRGRSGLAVPVAGLAVVLLLLVLGGGYLYLNPPRGSSDSDQVANRNMEPGADATNPQEKDQQPQVAAAPSTDQTKEPVGEKLASSATKPDKLEPSVTEPAPTTKAEDSKPAPEMPTKAPNPAAVTKPEPAKSDAKPTEPAKTDAKPATDTKPTPAPETPPKTDDLPKLTKEDLTKLGRAMQKARDAIGAHEFDRAEAFLGVAAEMPRLPEHQAKLDRLKLLSESVREYRKAIAESVSKLPSGSAFKVGESMVGVVESGPEKITLRVSGQNKSYAFKDMPVGLAAALAGQSLVEDDPTSLALKGAYVMASPKASAEDLKKAREFLEKAASTVDAAKELLLIFDDKYELTASAGK